MARLLLRKEAAGSAGPVYSGSIKAVKNALKYDPRVLSFDVGVEALGGASP